VSKTNELFARLRRQVAGGVWIEAVGVAATAFAAFAVLSYGLDRLLRLEVPYRAAFLLALVAGLAWIAWTRLIRPLRLRLADDELALALERRQAGLKQALISAVQFERALVAGARLESPELMRSVVGTVHERLPSLRSGDALDQRRVARHLVAAAGAALLLGGAAALDPASARLWAQRNLALSDVDWPRRTRLSFDGMALDEQGRVRLPQGDDLTVTVQAAGVIPERAHLRYAFAGGDRGSEPMTLTGGDRFTFTLASVLEDCTLRAEAGDGITPELHVAIVERPRLTDLRITLHHPEYLKRPPRLLDGAEGDLRVPRGGRLALEATSSKDLVSAFVAGGDTRAAAQLAGPRALRAELAPQASGLFVLDVVDRDQLGCARPPKLYVRIVEDAPPVLDWKTQGVGSMITPWARIPGRLKARDDYALTALQPLFRIGASEGAPAAEASDAQPASQPAFEPAPFTGLEGFRAGAAEFAELLVLDLKPLCPDADPSSPNNKVPVERFLSVKFTARDNHGPGEPHQSESETITFRVVTREKLLEELQRRQLEQRRDLAQVLVEEKADRAELAEILSPVEADPRSAQARLRLQAMAREQRALGKRVQGVAERYAAILEEMLNNRVIEPNEIRRLEGVIVTPLQRLAAEDFPRSAQTVADFAQAGAADVRNAAVAAYDAILQRLQAVLDEMQEAENLGAILEALRAVMKTEDDAIVDVEKKRDEAARKVFDPKPDDRNKK
jgi:hypothetical protein